MSWLRSLGVALLTGIAALFGAGLVAGLAVDWYNVSSFEGGSGFFVVGMALLGGLAGFVIGLVVSRVTARKGQRPFLTGLGASCGGVAAILALIAGGSWLFADIPPQIDGEELFMLAEVRWPAAGAPAPAALTGVPYLGLGALRGSVVRKFENGALFVEDARQEDGRWIVPGAVPIFTSRGGRLLDFGSDGHSMAAFLVPLPRYPWQRAARVERVAAGRARRAAGPAGSVHLSVQGDSQERAAADRDDRTVRSRHHRQLFLLRERGVAARRVRHVPRALQGTADRRDRDSAIPSPSSAARSRRCSSPSPSRAPARHACCWWTMGERCACSG